MKNLSIKHQIEKLKKELANKKQSDYTKKDKLNKLLVDTFIDTDKKYDE